MPEIMLIIVRSIISFVLLLALARFMGKQQMSQLTFFDYVVGITIGSIAASMSVDQNIKILNGLASLVIWGGFSILIALVTLKSYTFRKVTDGTPTVLIKNGQIQEKNLKKMRMPFDEIMPLLRQKNAFKLSDVELAVMETNGQLSVMKKTENDPITPKILGMTTENESEPQIVIVDGQLIEQSLKDTGYTKEWLLGEAMKQGADSLQDVYLAQIDAKGNVYIDLYNDQMQVPAQKEKPLLAASLKKVQADLEIFALQTEDTEAQATYEQQSKNLQQLIDQLQPYLK